MCECVFGIKALAYKHAGVSCATTMSRAGTRVHLFDLQAALPVSLDMLMITKRTFFSLPLTIPFQDAAVETARVSPFVRSLLIFCLFRIDYLMETSRWNRDPYQPQKKKNAAFLTIVLFSPSFFTYAIHATKRPVFTASLNLRELSRLYSLCSLL